MGKKKIKKQIKFLSQYKGTIIDKGVNEGIKKLERTHKKKIKKSKGE